EIAQRLAARDPANATWQRDYELAQGGAGDDRQEAGDLDGALRLYQGSLTIAQTLAARDAANRDWQHDLGNALDRIGNLDLARNDAAGALAVYQRALQLRLALTEKDPGNSGWLRSVEVGHSKVSRAARAAHQR